MGLLADFEEKILNYRSLPSGHTNLRTQLNSDDRNKGKPGETKMLCGARAGLQTVQVCQIVQFSEKYRLLVPCMFPAQRFNYEKQENFNAVTYI